MSDKNTILIVEDETVISNFIAAILTANQYGVLKAKSGSEAVMMVTSRCPDLVILDLGLPDMDGTAVLKSIREWSKIPVIVVSARTHERDKVEALDLGADDYITKPFGTAELLARVRTAFRHRSSSEAGPSMSQTGTFCTGDLTINYDTRHVYVNGEDVHLTQNEYKITALLSKYAGRVLTHDFIIKSVWGPNAAGDNQILRVNMANIRRKIERNPAEPQYIFTETRVGYWIKDTD